MNKEFIPYPEALALKELGFNMKTFAQYSTKIGDEWIISFNVYGEGQFTGNEGPCIAPTFSQCFRWFRDKYNFDSSINRVLTENKTYHFNVFADKFYGSIEYNTYEEAELACLIKLINICKKK